MVIAGGSGTSLLPHLPVAKFDVTDPILAVCERWLSVDTERARLLRLWGELEARLDGDERWYQQSLAEQHAPAAARALHEIEARLDVLASESDVLLRELCSGRATCAGAIIASLNIARRLLPPVDHDVVGELITNAVRDFPVACGLQ